MSHIAARQQLENVILPFWLEHGIDESLGGFFTCFDNRGRRRISTDKFTWSQGRFIWLLARAAALGRRGLITVEADQLLELASRGAQFLTQHAVLDDGTTRYVVGHDGGPPESAGQPKRSVYADWFVVMGLAELARHSGERAWLEAAAPILERSRSDHLAGSAPTPPYPIPAGHTGYGPRMILLNTLLLVAQAERGLRREQGHTTSLLAQALEDALSHRLPNGTFAEMPGPDPDSLISRHRIPGHAIEGLWMAWEALDLLGDDRDRTPLLESVDALCAQGWDPEYGGLLRYTDRTGPTAPQGTTAGTAYEQLVLDTWSTKLWWVHSEAAATTATAAQRYSHAPSAVWFDRIWRYTLDTFPGRGDGQEWVQIRDRAGKPLDQVVALPVKDPFHIARNLMQLVDLGAETRPAQNS